MLRVYYDALPKVHKHLQFWKKEAEQIPNQELRKQALLSFKNKASHCEGSSIYGLLTQQKIEPAIPFIVAYQAISDYLDNLCDRSTSLDPKDFRSIHTAILHALIPETQSIH
jgi:tetraprenyl-beta-curcumene synthase